MTQEDKELLLKDLCTRLPYGTKLNIKGQDGPTLYNFDEDLYTIWIEGRFSINDRGEGDEDGICEIKPYLRTISSMTDDEKDELLNLLFDKEAKYFYVDEEGFIDGKTSDLMKDGLNYPAFCPINIALYTDWLNSHHFDVHNLIGRGLAIDCTGLNIYEKTPQEGQRL